ncbi:anthranilate phosphoribosyltransferase [Oceanospirillum multiglobuliferum]|uniref:Anthranilate phosphoribosyltransferase n=1 Tax=Oceanospirillum multiglobuliferum TaxID=64969 RepID=A0A1T4Q2V7_9GAMM|nr:anthranilate phosphoribosyltransferase [Oceanospirillum multiglobuliferum]OPX55484.1 anthranilate phosphoribosyltransferase [Oceanospirillum multiglobuliferum]SJZ97831.1 anthranilate phosphoribosyltransferase [Oceanospirillum multiglobuliferum]
MNIQQALNKVVAHLDLSRDEMRDVMRQIMTGQCTDAQIGAFLTALRMKSESIDEITAAAEVMRELATPVQIKTPNAVDTCGTGGDGSNLFNVSTASAFVIAAAGGHVAKHGNRSVSSSSGSADLLEAASINLNLSPEQIARSIDEIGIGFMFAPMHHSAMKHAIGPRKELAMRTIFNMLGPITNPAGAKHQVIGVFSQTLCRPIAEVLQQLGSKHVLVVHAKDGLDEFSLATGTYVAELKDGQISEYQITPEDVGLTSQSLVGLDIDSAEASLLLIQDALGKQTTPQAKKAADMIALNAGAALYAADIAASHKEGVLMAQDAIYSGLAAEKMKELSSFTSVFA